MADWIPPAQNIPKPSNQPWVIFTDGAWGQSGAGASAMLVVPLGLRLKYAARLEFRATNNIVEYISLILGLSKAKALGARTLLIKTDSQVVTGQVEKEYMVRECKVQIG
jgi:ribonuclease HI